MSADWEKAAEAYLSADDFQSMKALAEAFAADRAAGVNSALVPAENIAIPQDVMLTAARIWAELLTPTGNNARNARLDIEYIANAVLAERSKP